MASTTRRTAPELSSAAPMPSMAKIRASSRPSTDWKASSASMQRVKRTTATPITAAATMGTISTAESSTTAASTEITIQARSRR